VKVNHSRNIKHSGREIVNNFLKYICAAQMKFLSQLLGITKLDKEKNQCIRQKKGAQNIANITRKSGYNIYRGWTQTDYQNKHYNINQKDEET